MRLDKIIDVSNEKNPPSPGKHYLLIPKKKKRGKWKKIILISMLSIFLICIGLILFVLRNLPSIESLKNYKPSIITDVYASGGEKIGEFFNERRIVTPLEEIPVLLRQAFVASEDDRFYEHKGLDPQGILRAFIVNILAGEVRQGGSTITQQVAKSLLLSPEKKLSRKIREAVLAFRMENNLTKDEILHLYLNQVYLGHGAYGVTVAAENYFGKNLIDLDLAEISILAGLVQAPSRYNPYTHMDRAKKRQKYVLEKMEENHFISAQERQAAFDKEIQLAEKVDYNSKNTPYFTENIRRYLVDKYTNNTVLTEGLRVYSTLDLGMQKAAQKALKEGLEELDKRQGYRGPLETVDSEKIEEYKNSLAQINVDRNSQPKEILKAIVLETDDNKNIVRLSTGLNYGTLLLEDMEWARKPDHTVKWSSALIEKPSLALKVGDVILVKPKEYEKLPDRFKKTKEDLSPFYSLEQQPAVEGAIIAMDVNTGHIKAMVGGYDFSKSEFNRTTQALRQPGSAFKPVIYSAAIDKGYTAARMIVDAPVVYDDRTQDKTWKPKNYGGKFYGKTILRDALIKSRNILTIKTVEDIGIDYLINYARKIGVFSELTRDSTIALGSSVVTPLELTRVYTVFASGGRIVDPIFIQKIENQDKQIIAENIIEPSIPQKEQVPDEKVNEKETAFKLFKNAYAENSENISTPDPQENKHFLEDGVISQETAFIITHLLKEVVTYGTARRVRALGRPAAGKTGTTNDNIDAWFVGYTPDLVAAVWVGFDEKKQLGRGEVGGSAASPIWLNFMQQACKNIPARDFAVPEGIVFVQIDPKTGKLASDKMQTGVFEAFLDGTQPTEIDDKEIDSQLKNFFIESQ